MCLGLSNAISHLILITAEKGELFWSTGKWKNSGQWDDVRRITQQVNDSRDSHSALPTGSPPTGLSGSNVFLTPRTLETIITSYFWWAKKRMFQGSTDSSPHSLFCLQYHAWNRKWQIPSQILMEKQGAGVWEEEGCLSAESLIEGEKSTSYGKNSVAWLEANPYDIHYCLSVQSVLCYKNQLHSIIWESY